MDLNELISEILHSKKYSNVDAAVVSRVCASMASKYPKKKDVIKAVKNELHIIHESFFHGDNCHKIAFELLSQLDDESDPRQMKEVCSRIMQLHSSTAERQNDIENIYDYLSSYITNESSVMDIGCGFNPFAIPYLAHMPQSYIALDINTETINLIQQFFELLKKPRLIYYSEVFDVAPSTPTKPIDVALLLKILPLLQQQKKGRGFSLLDELSFEIAVVSFPTKSLTGKQKGMEAFYTNLLEDSIPSSIEIMDRKTFSNEMFYILKKKSATIEGGL